MPAVASKPKKARQSDKTTARLFPSPTVPQIAPMAGETQAAFFDRAMRALRKQIPSINRRTIEVIKTWKQSANDHDLREKALFQFPTDKYRYYGPRCVFIEHTVPASEDGSVDQITYNRNALQHLVNWANYRIRNSDMFSAISDGHTPTSDEQAMGKQQPDVLGYAGPFYIGLLGDVNPKYAIYADEWIHNDDVPRFEKLQRRSPEVWCNEPLERRTLDPIAALGAETPRLDSGMNPYSRASDGRVVMRYSACAAIPGPDNSYIPGGSGKQRTHYGAQEMPFDPSNPSVADQGQQDSFDPNAGQQQQQPDVEGAVMAAIQGLLPSIMQAVAQQLGLGDDQSGDQMPQDGSQGFDDQSSMAGADDGSDVPRGMNPSPAADPSAMADGGMSDQSGQSDQTGVNDQSQSQPADDMDDDEKRQYSAMSPMCQTAYMAGRKRGMMNQQRPTNGTPNAQYSRGAKGGNDLHSVVARQQVELQRLREEMRQRDRDAMRYSRLAELDRTYVVYDKTINPQTQKEFGLDTEMELVLDLTDEQFDKHCSKVVTRYQRRDAIDNAGYFPEGEDIPDDVERYSRGGGSRQMSEKQIALITRYSREAADLTVRKNAAKPGSTTYEAEYTAIMKQHGLSV